MISLAKVCVVQGAQVINKFFVTNCIPDHIFECLYWIFMKEEAKFIIHIMCSVNLAKKVNTWMGNKAKDAFVDIMNQHLASVSVYKYILPS